MMDKNVDNRSFLEAEKQVVAWLKAHGHIILARNYSQYMCGEIDIISLYDKTIYATEVKARQIYSAELDPSWGFTNNKKKKVLRTFQRYLDQTGQLDRSRQLLAAEVLWNKQQIVQQIEIFSWD